MSSCHVFIVCSLVCNWGAGGGHLEDLPVSTKTEDQAADLQNGRDLKAGHLLNGLWFGYFIGPLDPPPSPLSPVEISPNPMLSGRIFTQQLLDTSHCHHREPGFAFFVSCTLLTLLQSSAQPCPHPEIYAYITAPLYRLLNPETRHVPK